MSMYFSAVSIFDVLSRALIRSSNQEERSAPEKVKVQARILQESELGG